jgi:hypothetical protein
MAAASHREELERKQRKCQLGVMAKMKISAKYHQHGVKMAKASIINENNLKWRKYQPGQRRGRRRNVAYAA